MRPFFENRIIGYGTKPADQFMPNELNYRKHPQKQRDAVQASLRELGWIGVVVENRQTGRLIDGHERVWQALKNNEDVPYIEVDLTEDEERLALAVFDPITYMAETDYAMLDTLLREVDTNEAALQELLADLVMDLEQVQPYDSGKTDEVHSLTNELGMVYSPTFNKKRTIRFVSLRKWSTKTKKRDIDALNAVKNGKDIEEWATRAATEIANALLDFVGVNAFAWVTTPPRSHLHDLHFGTLLAQGVADKLSIPFVVVFADRPRESKSHPRHFYKRGEIALLNEELPEGFVLLVDDVATSATTLEDCSNVLRKTNAVLPMVWLYEEVL